jgi:MscS family membrane protein
MEAFTESLSTTFLHTKVENWALFLLVIVITLVVQKLIVVILGKRIMKMTQNTSIMLDELLLKAFLKPFHFSMFFVGFNIALRFLQLPDKMLGVDVNRVISVFMTIVLTISLTWFLLGCAEIIRYYLEKVSAKTDTKLDDQLVPIVVKALKILIVTMSVLIVLQNFGYSITSILASLGIGGVAVALASKDTVENIFGSIVVFSDKPFQLGDWVIVGDVEGTIEEVGIRSTKIRRFDNALVSLPNSKLTTSAIINFSRMEKRRIKFRLGIGYSSTSDQIRAMVSGIRQIIADDERFNHDYYLVHFDEFGDSALGIFIYSFTKTTVWAEYLQVREDFLLAIKELSEKVGVEIAFPTRTVYLRQEKD